MTSKFVDYDAAFSELEEQSKPLVRRLFGRDWELPGVPPAAVLLRIARMMADGKTQQDLTGGDAVTIAGDMIPGDILDEWMRRGLTVDQLALIVQDLIDAYGPQFAGADGDGDSPEAGAPTGASPTSSNTGDSSKPTSHASTGSIFQVG